MCYRSVLFLVALLLVGCASPPRSDDPAPTVTMIPVVPSAIASTPIITTPTLPTATLPPSTPTTAPSATPASALVGGQRTRATGCHVRGPLPDPTCSPGAVFPDVTSARICTPGYATSVRDVSESEKSAVYAEYGITSHQPGQYEVDHIVSLELGGSNDIANLYPEAAEPRPGFHEKDKVENELHGQVCSGKLTLHQAQVEIATNWLIVYQQTEETSTPLPMPTASRIAATSTRAPASAASGQSINATAKCRDGTFSFSANHRGTCSHHGGVAVWYR